MMTAAPPQELGLLAKIVLFCAIVLIIAGIVWHGITAAVFTRLWNDLIERPEGEMKFRFVLQPLMAALVAFRDGRNDAKEGRSPFFATVMSSRQERIGRLREGLNATARILLLGLVMDVIYQVLVLKTFYPNEAVIIAIVLAFLPYVVVRSLVARALHRPEASGPAS